MFEQDLVSTDRAVLSSRYTLTLIDLSDANLMVSKSQNFSIPSCRIPIFKTDTMDFAQTLSGSDLSQSTALCFCYAYISG